jgi:hypothetical protein
MKTRRKVMLGCWGLGGALSHSRGQRKKLQLGPFEGHTIPSAVAAGLESLSLGWHLPPLARQTQDGVDLMPFVLYDEVTMDRLSFDCLIGARPSLSGWHPSPRSVAILERLASAGDIVLEDYLSHLSSPEVAQLVDEMNVMDLSDPSILPPTVESLELWIHFYKDLFGATDVELSKFHTAIAALSGHGPRNAALGYLYECVSDINRILILAQEFQQPIYEWEDYCRYYRYKFLRTAQLVPGRPRGRTLSELFDVFIPNFTIRSYEELEDLRDDGRLGAVRSLVDNLGDRPIDKDIVIQANTDVLRIKRKIDTFSKYIGLIGYPLSLLPGPASNVVQDVAGAIAKRWFEKKVQWQMFFVERALCYDGMDVAEAIKKQENEQH